MPRFQITLRQMIGIVAVAAVVLGLFLSWVRYGRLAADDRNGRDYFARIEARNLASIAQMDREIAEAEERGDVVEASRLKTYFAPQARRDTERMSRLRRLYDHAASHPWETLPIELRRKPFPH